MSSYFVLKIQYVNRPPETRNISAATTSIGRESGDIVLNDPQTSGRHAEILFQTGQVRVRDVGSTNGTWFNGQRLMEFVLEPGQWFQAGQTTLQLMAVHGEQPVAPAKTMMAMGAPPPAGGPAGAPPQGWGPPPSGRPPGGPPPGAPPGPPGYPPPAAAPYGAPAGGPPPGPPGGAPPWGPPPGQPMGGPPPGPPMGGPPMGGPPMGGPPPGPPMGGPPMGGPPMGGRPPGPPMGGPPMGGPPMGGPPMGGPPMGGPPMGGPPQGGPPFGGPPGGPQPPYGPPGGPPPGGQPPYGGPQGGPPQGGPPYGGPPQGGPPQGGPQPPYGPPPGGPQPPYGPPPGGPPPPYGPAGGPPPGPPMGGPPMGGPPMGGPPMGGPPMGPPMGGPPMGPPMGGPPMGGPPMGGPPMARPGGPPMGGPMGGPPMGPGGFGGPPAPMGQSFAPAPMGMGGGGMRPNFQGTGGELFVTYLVGALLTGITFGIYMSWFICKMTNFVFSNMTLGPTRRGELRLEFTGRGGELFVTYLVGGLLTGITFGIYMSWFAVKLIKFFTNNITATAQDGTRYRLHFEGTGGELFVTFLVGGLLCMVTANIYLPWFICKLRKVLYQRTAILENEQPVGNLDFEGKGGELFVIGLVGVLLIIVTATIYRFWFEVKMQKFYAENTRINYQGRTFAGAFNGTGGEYFVTVLLGALLCGVTIGIYMPWFLIKLWKFDFNNLEFNEIGAAPGGMQAFPPQQQQMMPAMR